MRSVQVRAGRPLSRCEGAGPGHPLDRQSAFIPPGKPGMSCARRWATNSGCHHVPRHPWGETGSTRSSSQGGDGDDRQCSESSTRPSTTRTTPAQEWSTTRPTCTRHRRPEHLAHSALCTACRSTGEMAKYWVKGNPDTRTGTTWASAQRGGQSSWNCAYTSAWNPAVSVSDEADDFAMVAMASMRKAARVLLEYFLGHISSPRPARTKSIEWH